MRGQAFIVGKGLWVDNDTGRACLFDHHGQSGSRFYGIIFHMPIEEVTISHTLSYIAVELV